MGQRLVGRTGEPLLNHVNGIGLYRHGGGTAFQRGFALFHKHKPINATENREDENQKASITEANCFSFLFLSNL